MNKISSSGNRGFILVFFMLLLLACVSQVGQPIQTPANPETNPNAGGQTMLPKATSPKGSAFPFTISEKTLQAFEITDFSNLKELPVYSHMAEDGKGVLHVIWGQIDQIYHRQLDANGQWSDITTINTNKPDGPAYAKLLIAPNGQACVLWPSSVGLAQGKFNVECFSAGQWSPSLEMETQLNPVNPLAGYITYYQAQFDTEGHLQIFSHVFGGNDPIQTGFYLGDQRLFPDEDTSGDEMHQFTIDQKGNYHLLFQRNHTFIYRLSNDQGKTWREPTINTGVTINDGYASLAPEQNMYFHFLQVYADSGSYIATWISTHKTPEGLPLFDKDKMWEKVATDERYVDLITFHPQVVAIDKDEKLHFIATSEKGLCHVILENDGSWWIQYLHQDAGYPVELLVNQKNEVFFLGEKLADKSGGNGLFFVNLTE